MLDPIETNDFHALSETMVEAGIKQPLSFDSDAREAFRLGFNHGLRQGADAAACRVESVLGSTRLNDAQTRAAVKLALASDLSADEVVDFVAKAHETAAAGQRKYPGLEERMAGGRGEALALGGPLPTRGEEEPEEPSPFSAEGAAKIYAARKAQRQEVAR